MNFSLCEKYMCCIIPGLGSRRKNSEQKFNVKCGKEHLKKTCRLRNTQYYLEKREKILSGIKTDYSKMVVLWNCSCSTYHTEILHTLKQYGKYRIVKDAWIVYKTGEQIWCDTVVEFARKMDARKATAELQKTEKYVTLTLLEKVVSKFVDFEVLQPDTEGISTRIKINKRYRLRDSEMKRLHNQLYDYGSLGNVLFNYRFDRNNVVCEATYRYATQAYLATLMTNGTYLIKEGIVFPGDAITVDIEMTEREREIFREVKKSYPFIY